MPCEFSLSTLKCCKHLYYFSALYRTFLGLIILATIGGVLYGYLRKDFSGGFTIASYAIACVALLLALLAASEFLGMETPDSFSGAGIYSQDMVVLERDFERNNGAGRIIEGNTGVGAS
jgi:hypothetical protein